MSTDYEFAHEAPFEQLLRWWKGEDPIPQKFGDEGLDWVAAEMVEHGEDGVAELKTALKPGADLIHRNAALDALASPQVDDPEVDAAMLEDFTQKPERRTALLWSFIHMGSFPIEREVLEELTTTADDTLRGAKVAYLSRLLPEESTAILTAALADTAPAVVEAACDEVGEWGLAEFRPVIEKLLEHDNPEIVFAAEGCLDMLDLDDGE